ncbi:hypothetical protein DL93DRAFT_2213906 [Clavulina sp. PMI_390]|nr:hypothetical protein DL93DRAFT_2213906 [Clavulina sp. PMI_390]
MSATSPSTNRLEDFSTDNSPESLADVAAALLTSAADNGMTFSLAVGSGVLPPTIQTAVQDAEKAFHKLDVKEIRLSHLEQIYKTKNHTRALELLAHPHRVKIDSHLKYEPEQVAFTLYHFLDFIAAFPSEMGLAAVLPPIYVTPAITWVLQFDLKFHYRAFFFKHGMLRYDPAGAVCCIGHIHGLDMWAFFVSASDLESGAPTAKAGKRWTNGPTQLSTRHLRMFYSWLIIVRHLGVFLGPGSPWVAYFNRKICTRYQV